MPATDLTHPQEDRPLPIQEYKCIQEFPDKWELADPLIQQYKQVGNAVPNSLGYAVGEHIKKLPRGEEPKQYPTFRYSRYKNTSNFEWEEQFNKALEKAMSIHHSSLQTELMFG